MNLLAGTNYDPAVAVSKSSTAGLALTAIDTTNLRLTFTVPASGKVKVILGAVVHGATTFPSILLGVLSSGSTVAGRSAPCQSLGNTAVATAMVKVQSEFLVTGLSTGVSQTWDAAYGVETLIAATGLKYGGPNNTTANDAFGGFAYEIWDPQPLPTAAPATVGGLITSPTTANVALADLARILGTVVATPATAGVIDANVKNINNTAAATPGASGGVLISGSNSGTTTLAALTVTAATTLTGNVVLSDGLTISAPSTLNRAGLDVTGNGTGAAMKLAAGATGKGVAITTTAGDGLSILPTAGSAIVATGNGTSKHGIIATGGTAGTSDGVSAVAGTGGVDIRGNITGNLVGTVSTLTTYTGNTVQTGDSFARIGAAGAGLTAVVAASVTGAVGSVTAGVTVTTNNDKTGYGLSAAAVQAIWDALTSALTTVGSIGKLLVTNIDALISSRTKPADTQAAVTSVTNQVSANVTAVNSVTVTGSGTGASPWGP